MHYRLLVVCSVNSGKVAPFINEQVDSIKKLGFEADYFLIKSKGALGYLKSYEDLISKIKSFHPDIIHAHYGLSGLLANMQRKVPVVTTYHGSDINLPKVRKISYLSILLSARNIFVSEQMLAKVPNRNALVIPCGVDSEIFKPINKEQAKKELGMLLDRKYILFSSGFDNRIKNAPLAIKAVEILGRKYDVELVELKGRTRYEVSLLMSASDVGLMTSFSEGSPQFIKEALMCNLPCVSTDVGSVREMFSGNKSCFITSFKAGDVADNLMKALSLEGKVDTRSSVFQLDLLKIAQKITAVYSSILSPN